MLLESSESAVIRAGHTRAAQIAQFLSGRTLRRDVLKKCYSKLRKDYETMRFKRGAYALNIVSGCYLKWRAFSKKEKSLRLRL